MVVNPYLDQEKTTNTFRRVFSQDVDEMELVWHRDRYDRYITVCEGQGWKIQFDNEIPQELLVSETYYIPHSSYHRILKGEGDLVIAIVEDYDNGK